MAKIKSNVVFKSCNQQQALLLPPSLDELIPATSLARVVNHVVDQMDVSGLINLYEGGGTSAYHPRMLLKVLLYGYSIKVYTGRRIARALKQDIHFMWLSAMSYPDFRTINSFRSGKAKEAIEALFKSLLAFLMAHGYIRMENYFCDGSTFMADANRHKIVWKKNAQRFKEQTEQRCRELFKEIDALNGAEEKQYGNKDLEEHGTEATITPEAIAGQVSALDEQLQQATDKARQRKIASLKKKLEETAARIETYDEQIDTAAARSGYSRTDPDATAMRMKNKVETLPAYNVMAGSEDQFITGISTHQNPNDATCFSEHITRAGQQQPQVPQRIVADSIFGTEQNYELLERAGIENYMKYPAFHAEQTKKYQEQAFLKERFPYDAHTDSYRCPQGRSLYYKETREEVHPRSGYVSRIKEYGCADCGGCPLYSQCCKSTVDGNRSIQINERLNAYKAQARKHLDSEQGRKLRGLRSTEIESCFGDIKHNMGFRRFHLRKLEKVHAEITLIAMAHNLRKLHLKGQQAAA